MLRAVNALRRTALQPTEKPFENTSEASEPAQHEADHRQGDEGPAGGAQPLILLAEPPILRLPCERPLHHPASGKHAKARRGQGPSPNRSGLALVVGQIIEDPGVGRTAGRRHDLRRPAKGLFNPLFALVLSMASRCRASVEPVSSHTCRRRGNAVGIVGIESGRSNLTTSRSMTSAVCTAGIERQARGIAQQMALATPGDP